ncbi:hypothetical protein [Streptosporangium sp. NPDC002721]|uniref:hypothetical protein n=1 Tax=Streptosporangium sp. NPDC002721 TaxID=3366188 RepID=UPI0036B3D39D
MSTVSGPAATTLTRALPPSGGSSDRVASAIRTGMRSSARPARAMAATPPAENAASRIDAQVGRGRVPSGSAATSAVSVPGPRRSSSIRQGKPMAATPAPASVSTTQPASTTSPSGPSSGSAPGALAGSSPGLPAGPGDAPSSRPAVSTSPDVANPSPSRATQWVSHPSPGSRWSRSAPGSGGCSPRPEVRREESLSVPSW